MLEVGGQAVEIPANEADVHLAERIRDEGALLSGNASIWRPTWESEGVQWNCMGNALRLREVEPEHTFNLWIGEGLHDVPGIGPAWELHTAAVDETGQLWEATSQPAAYCGFAVSDYDYWFWAFAVGGDTAFAGFLN